MDFLPLPNDVSSHLMVPDLGGPEYDNEGFLGYDRRLGWNVAALREGNFFNVHQDLTSYLVEHLEDVPAANLFEKAEPLIQIVVAPFIQTWIVLGIMHEALGRPISRHELSRTLELEGEDGKTRSIQAITVQDLYSQFLRTQRSRRDDNVWLKHLATCLSEAAWVLLDLNRLYDTIGSSVLPLPIYMSLSILVQSMSMDISVHSARDVDVFDSFQFASECTPLRQDLVKEGWCPSMVQRLTAEIGPGGLYYASLVPGFGTTQTHRRCDSRACVASNVEKGTYRTQHVASYCICRNPTCDHARPDCPCTHYEVSETELSRALADGGFPVVRFKDAEDSEPEMVRIDSRHQASPGYVAISHVWSDGRGNEQANSLPLCQLKSISQYVRQLNPRHADDPIFWIDTLCVPVKEPLRNTAIMRMAQIYEQAVDVLVLSEELLSHELPRSPDLALFDIFCCKWMTRLWTMQEGALASSLVFQFKDRTATFNGLFESISELALVDDISHIIGTRAMHRLESVVNLRSGKSGFHNFWHGLGSRSSSRATDVAICGSILLPGSDLERVLAASDEDKMQTFWACQAQIPASVLWVPCPRMEHVPGFRWAPSNLLQVQSRSLSPPDTAPLATPTDRGLLVTGLEAVLLERVVLPDLEPEDYGFAMFHFSLSGSGSPSPRRYYFGRAAGESAWESTRVYWSNRVVILLPRFPTDQGPEEGALATLVDVGDAADAADADGKAVERETRARYLATVSVYLQGGAWDHIFFEKSEGGDHQQVAGRLKRPVLEVGQAWHMGKAQQWCVC